MSCLSRVVKCVLVALVVATTMMTGTPQANGQGLQRQGSRLFYCGQPIRLVGYGFYGVVTQKGFPYKQYLDILADQYNVNFIRVWGNFHWTASLTPYGGSWKNWNLQQQNAEFYQRLYNVVDYAQKKGIIVQFTFFDSVCLEDSATSGNRWKNCPFRNGNNQQPYLNSPQAFDDVPSAIWSQSHLPYITKVVQTLNGFDNVIYEPMNEPYPGYGGASFIQKVINVLHTQLNAPDHKGSRIISSNDGAYNNSNNPKVDVVSYHIHSTDQGNDYKNLNRPVIVSNDGDKAQSSKSLKPDSARAARVKKLGQKAFNDGSAFGHTHLEILDKDIYGSTWLSQNYQPSVNNLTWQILAAVKSFTAGAPKSCAGGGGNGPPGGGNCPAGSKIAIDNNEPGYSETGNDWATWGGLGQSMGKNYRFLSNTVGGNDRKGTAKWKPKITIEGMYKVTAVFRATHNRTDDADYYVIDSNGKKTHYPVDQRDGSVKEGDAHGPVTADLGTHFFKPGTNAHVLLDGTDDNKSDEADGVTWVLVDCQGDGGGGGGGGPVEPPPPPVDPCPVAGEESVSQTRFASSVPKVQGWDYEGKAEGPPDGQFAHNKNLDKGEALHAGSFNFCDPPGPEKITGVTVSVRSKIQYASGKYQLIAKLKAAGAQVTWSHTGMGWDNLEITAQKPQWTWADVNSMVATVALHAHPGGENDSDIWVDAFRAKVSYVGCGKANKPACTADGNATFIDECGNQSETVKSCDDKNICTIDGCLEGKCVNTKSNSPGCVTVAPPACKADVSTQCVGGAIMWVDGCGNLGAIADPCDDANACTMDTCDPVSKKCLHLSVVTGKCDPCGKNADQSCIGGALMWKDMCGNVTDLAESCDDGNACTADACDQSKKTCDHKVLDTPQCKGCVQDVEKVCMAGNVMFKDSCGNLGGVAADCDDHKPCTIDSCDPATLACVNTPSQTEECKTCQPMVEKACQGDTVVWKDSCGNVNQVAQYCDDANPCTIDSCDPAAAACSFVLNPTPECDPCKPAKADTVCDGDNIVWVDGCGEPGEVFVSCDDGDACTTDTCDEATLACAYLPANDGAGCECEAQVGQKCMGADVVWVDSCGNVGATVSTCSDDDACTVDKCDALTLGCVFEPSEALECKTCVPQASTACDGTSVVWLDSCGQMGAVFTSCTDDDECTIDMCDPKSGACVHLASDALGCENSAALGCDLEPITACDNGNVVWIDGCGQLAGVMDVCMDFDPCTDDYCDAQAAACVFEPVDSLDCKAVAGADDEASVCDQSATVFCDEGALIWIDACGEAAGVADSCTDNDPCTVDTCSEAQKACVYTPLSDCEEVETDDPETPGPGEPGDPAPEVDPNPETPPSETGVDPEQEDEPAPEGVNAPAANLDDPATADGADDTDVAADEAGCQASNGGAGGALAIVGLSLLLLMAAGRKGVSVLILIICLGAAGEAKAQPVPMCGAQAPGPHSVTMFAATVPIVNGWDYEGKAQGGANSTFAHNKNLDPGETLTGANYWFCNPTGNELITKVVVGVRTKVQYDSGKYKVNVKLKVAGKEKVFSHKGLGWDEIDVTSKHPLWTWEFARDLKPKVMLHNHPGGNNDSDVWVDAFRVRVEYTTCTPNVSKICSGGLGLTWMDSCGMAVGPAGSCDDGNKCTDDSCSGAGVCKHTPNQQCCKAKAQTACVGNQLYWYDSCGKKGALKDACNDGNECTVNTCNASKKACEFPKSTAPKCNCKPNSQMICESNTLYWADSCGVKGAKVQNCNDGDECTIDTCNASAQKCETTPSTLQKCLPCQPEAQKACLGGELVWLDSCGVQGEVADKCDDGDKCTIDSCDPTAVKCTTTPSTEKHCLPCLPQAELTCLGNDVWWLDSCGDKDIKAETCDDGDKCTIDSCNAATNACDHEPVLGGDCDTPCTPKVDTLCEDGQIFWVDGCGNTSEKPADDCNDGDECTIDGCDPAAKTCTHEQKNTAACTVCTPNAKISCVAGDLYSLDSCNILEEQVQACEDGDPCTLDSCMPDTGECMNLPSDAPECHDCVPFSDTKCQGNAIVWVDSCGNTGDEVVSCDDGNACTIDTCDANTAFCVHAPSATPACDGVQGQCDGQEGTVCMDDHIAWVDSCGNITGVAKACLDGDPCTFDTCNPDTVQCTSTQSQDDECVDDPTAGCDDVPTVICEGASFYWVNCGKVVGTAKICDDGDQCTTDFCNPDTLQCDTTFSPKKGCEELLPEDDEPDPGPNPNSGGGSGEGGSGEGGTGDVDNPEPGTGGGTQTTGGGTDDPDNRGMTIWGGSGEGGLDDPTATENGAPAPRDGADTDEPDMGSARGSASRGCAVVAIGMPDSESDAPAAITLLLAFLGFAVLRRR